MPFSDGSMPHMKGLSNQERCCSLGLEVGISGGRYVGRGKKGCGLELNVGPERASKTVKALPPPPKCQFRCAVGRAEASRSPAGARATRAGRRGADAIDIRGDGSSPSITNKTPPLKGGASQLALELA